MALEEIMREEYHLFELIYQLTYFPNLRKLVVRGCLKAILHVPTNPDTNRICDILSFSIFLLPFPCGTLALRRPSISFKVF